LKRALHVVDELRDPPVWTPVIVQVGEKRVSIVDTGDGEATRRFVAELVKHGATPCEPDGEGALALRIVIRGTPSSADARLRADVLEEGADLVLGAARAGFARQLARQSAKG
jgi:hypothetical protein